MHKHKNEEAIKANRFMVTPPYGACKHAHNQARSIDVGQAMQNDSACSWKVSQLKKQTAKLDYACKY